MKPIHLLLIVLNLANVQFVIAQARESNAMIDNKNQPVISLEVNAPAKQVRKAWNESSLWQHLEGKKRKSFHTYRDAPMTAWGGDTLDVYTRVEAAGRDKTILYIAAARPDGSFISTKSDSVMADKIKRSMYDFVKSEDFPSIDLTIQQCSDSVEMDEADYKTYLGEKKKLDMQHTRLSEKINELERKYEKDKSAWQLRRQRLEDLKKSREIVKDK